ncbi:dynamin family protein [Nostoc sp. FACHB-280]|uniref:dynamin family protein n=1 Tax=Nostoc sp. FACHB-280 TaxID=2692839 RepID=UPI00168B37BB|nr:dynamin family protein [Nostoc sp. FACHB-280]MBD2496530.1 dynamin family protein [Nostoc sp. FACHB-280]
MDTSLVNTQLLDWLSQMSGQKLTQRELTRPVIFLANLVTILLGVIFVDGTVAEEEKQRLLKTLYLFSTPESNVRRLTHLMIKGIKENQTYKRVNDLLLLSDSLSDSEKLLLIAFGYEMSATDGVIDPREKQYLEVVGNHLGINQKHLAVLEIGFTHQTDIDLTALDEVKFLLDPSRFFELDVIFIKATTDMLTALPAKNEHKVLKQKIQYSYSDLKKVQDYQKQLDYFCHNLYQLIADCKEHGFLADTLINEVSKISQKLQSQRFRLAVIGEFSQGKSTLLNALLGEVIQPVREIPCSGTVTVLKYGTCKRVICRYKNGTEEEIPFSEYQLKASISEDAALGCLSDELANSEVKEIVFEHPDLALCSSGVEIIDSPGLNEHPDRTVVTQQVLKDTDAVIFLTNVSRSLTQTERELLQDLRIQLNGGKENEPTNNLFVVGNFMDMVRTEKGREQVKQRVERFLQGENPLIIGENRIHFISAQAALEAMLGGEENEYLTTFQNFTQAIEKFLTDERGTLKINLSLIEINSLIQKCRSGLSQAEKILDGKINISESEKQKIFEQIGEASGRDVRIRLVASQLVEQVIEQAAESWDEWWEGLEKRITEKSQHWHSEHNPAWSQDRLIQDYINQFIRDISKEIDDWGNKTLKDVILNENIKILDANIEYELDAVQAEFRNIEQQVKTDFSEQLQLTIDGINDDFMGFGGFGGGLGIGGALAAGLLAFTGIGLVAIIIASLAATIAGSFGFGLFDIDGLHNQIKLKVINIGFQKLNESTDKVAEKLHEITTSVFDTKVESASRVISQAILLYENLLEQHEKAYQETLEQREAEKVWIFQKYQELEKIKNSIEAIL